jgi:hypothetical protein
MRNTLEDWADDPVEFMGLVVGLAIPAMLLSAIATGIVPPYYGELLRLVFEWVVNASCAAVLATMFVGAIDGQAPGAARVLMPVFCLGVGSLLLGIAQGNIDAVAEVSAGRVGVSYLSLGVVLCVSNVVRVLPQRANDYWKPGDT